MATKIKYLPENVKSFETASRKYIVHDNLTEEGMAQLELFRVEMEAGMSPSDMRKSILKGWQFQEKGQFGSASVHFYNAISASDMTEDRRKAIIMLILTLFARPEGSNISHWDEAEATQWIEDWNEDGYASTDLFRLAAACQQTYASAFRHSSPMSSENESPQSESA